MICDNAPIQAWLNVQTGSVRLEWPPSPEPVEGEIALGGIAIGHKWEMVAKRGETWVELPSLIDRGGFAGAEAEVWIEEQITKLQWSLAVRPGLKAADIERRVAVEGVAV